MPKFLNLISQSGKDEFVDISEFNRNPNAYGKYKIRMVDDATGKNYNIPATMFGEAQKDGLRAWNMDKQATKQKQVQNPAFQTPMPNGNLPADWGNAEMVNPKGFDAFGTNVPTTKAQQDAKDFVQGFDDAIKGRKTDGTDAWRDTMQRMANMNVQSAKKQFEDQIDYAKATDKPLTDDFLVQNLRNEENGFSMNKFGVAPTVARDKNGKPILDQKGDPVKGWTTDDVRASVERQTDIAARQRELELNKKTTEEKLSDLYRQRELLKKKLDTGDKFTSMYQSQYGTHGVNNRETQLQLIEVEKAIQSLEAVRDKDELAWNGFFRGFENTAGNLRSWDFGLSDLALMGKMEEIKGKIDKGQQLTADEQELATSKMGADAAAALEDETMGNTYRWAKIGGESLPFMADFMLTGGYRGIAVKFAREASKLATKTLARNVLRNTGTLIGDVVGAYGMALTTQAGKTTADILRRHQGSLTVDENGNFKFEGGESMPSAIAHGLNAAAIENYTEKFGEHLNFAKAFGKYGTEGMTQFFQNLSNKGWAKTMNAVAKRGGINGYIPEVIEEEIGLPLNALITGDNSWSDVLDVKQQADILGGMAISIGAMGALGLGVHLGKKGTTRLAARHYESKLNDADFNAAMAFDHGKWLDLKDVIDNTENKYMPSVQDRIIKSPALTPEQKIAANKYINTLLTYRGFNLGLIANMNNAEHEQQPARTAITPTQIDGKTSYAITYHNENGEEIGTAPQIFNTLENAEMYKQMLDEKKNDIQLQDLYSSIYIKDRDGSIRQSLDQQLQTVGLSLNDISRILNKSPFRRTDKEIQALDIMKNIANGMVYPPNEVHEEKDAQDGADLAEGTPVGDQATIDIVNEREANAISQWNQVADPDLQSSIKDLYEQGKTSNDIFDWLVANEYSEDVIAAFAELCNSGAQKDKFIEVTGQKIEEQVNQKVQQVTFAGTLNGAKSPIILQVQDQTGAPMYVVSGDISIIPTDVGNVIQSDGLIILRDEQGNFIQRPDTNGLTLVGTQNAEDYRNQLLTQTQETVTAQIQSTEYKAPEYNDSDMESQAPEAPQDNGLTAPQPATQPANTNEQQGQEPEQEPAIPTDEDGNLLYHKAPIEATINDLYNGELDDEEIRDFVQNKINESSKEYDKANKKKPKIGTDKNAYLQAKAEWQSQVDEAKQQLDYWNSVQNYIQQQTHTTPEEIKAAQDELSGTTARLEYARQAPEGATTPEQIAGEFVKNAKIQPEDFYRETGLTAADARKQYPGMLSNDGATIARLAEQLVQYDNDNYGGMFFKGDDMEARNYIIDALKNAPSRKSLGRDMTAEEQEYVNQYEEQREVFHQEAYGMSYSDYLAFEEQEMPNIWRRISNFAPEQYDQMVAEYYESLPEDYFTPQNEQQNGTEGQQDNGLADSTTVLPQPPTDNETGSGQREDPAAETGNGSEGDNQNEEVPGGTQGVGQQEGKSKKWEDMTYEEKEATDPIRLTAELVLADAEKYAKESKHKVEIVGFNYDTLDVKITVDGKASNITYQSAEEYGENEKGYWVYNTQSQDAEEFSNLLDEYNKGVEYKEKGFEGETPCAFFFTADAAIAFENWLRDREAFADVKEKINNAVAKSKYDVKVVEYNEEEWSARISVNGVESRIVLTPTLAIGRGNDVVSEYIPEEGVTNQDIAELLDEYNEGLDQEEQGSEAEEPGAYFASIDAAIAFENWLNDKNSSSSEAEQNNKSLKEQIEQERKRSRKIDEANKKAIEILKRKEEEEKASRKDRAQGQGERVGAAQFMKFAEKIEEAIQNKDINAIAQWIQFYDNTVSAGGEPFGNEINLYNQAKQILENEGYTIRDYKYMPYNEGMKIDADFVIDDSLPAGTRIITKVLSPELQKDGVLAKKAKVIVTQTHQDIDDADLSDAEKDDESPKEKTWDEMDENEKMEYVFSQPLLTEEQIKNAQTNEVNKANALAYIKGQKSMVTSLSYFITYKNVKHNTGSSPANNEAGNTSQLDETNSGGGKGRRAEGKHSGLGDSRLDSEGSGQTNPNQSGEQLLRSEDGKGRPADDSGKEGDKQVPGDEQPVGRPDTGSDGSTGSGIDNGNGHNVPQQGGKGRSRKNTDANRREADRANRDGATGNAQLNSENIDSQLQSEIDEFKNLLADYRNIKNKKNGNINSSIIPGVTINSEKIEAWGRLIYQGAKVGYLLLRKGHTSLSEWSRIMKDMLTPAMHDIEITDAEIDEFIKEMWHCNLPIGDEVHTISEWSRIIQKNKLKEAVRLTLEEKKKKQLDAEPIKVKIADKNNIAETLPYLLPLQQDDVYKAEMQFFDESHNDYDHAYGKGYMFTNGTGTGKTYTGLGIVKRFIKQGKGRVLILTPSSTKVKDWVLDAANLNIKAHNLEEWARAHKTTATTSKAEGVVVTTYANFRQNQALLEDEFDLVIYDESHRLLENKKGGETEGSKQHYMLTNKDEQWAFSRLQTVNQTYQEIQKTRKQYDSEYDKEKEKFQDKADAKFYLPMLTEHISKHEGYPNLKAIKEKYDSLVKKYNNEVKPQLEKQAKESVKKTKVVFLSATPFNTKENLGYAEGYIFQYPQTEGRIGRRSQFYLTNFGSAYRWRNNRLESRTTNPEAVAAQEVAFSDYLQNQLGTMSGRVIDSEYDYSRDFPTVTFEKADELNTAFEEIKKMEGVINKAFYDVMTNYQYTSVLFEAMKTSCILPRIREHINAGRKVVLFHRRMESARPITPPFQEILNKARVLLDGMSRSKEKNEAKAAIADYEQRFAHMLEWEKTLDLRVPRVQILEEFGDDSVLFFSGKETTKQKNAAVEEFNRDSSPKKIIVIQEASGKEGISLHDVTGENQRVLISLAMPQSPITALQIEGRIYRIGNKSNAIFEYPLLGLDEELITWGQRFNAQVGTTENLALGSKARNLRESFARAVIEHSGDVPLDSQGTGGKEMDKAINQDQTDPFDKSILDFYGNAKTSGRRDNREGKDYYPTPEPLGFMMVKWANLSEGESVLEPSAGHGAIARYVPPSNQLTSVEPSTALFGRLQVLAGGIGRKFENDIFENYNIINKHDVVLMNPPFGTAGRLAIDHVAKAFKHLSEGGRIVAIIPRGSADAKFDKWIQTEKTAALVGEIQLPNITFQNAGTQVACRVVVIDKISNEQMRNEALENATQIELPNNYDKIEDFFEDLRGITMPARTIDQKTKNDKKVMPIIKEFKDEYGDDFSVEFTPTGVIISGTGFDYLNLNGDKLKMLVAAQYARANKIIPRTPSRLTRVITAYETIKKMALKLADMSEEEMENYVRQNINDNTSVSSLSDQFVYEVKKNTRTGQDMHVVSKNKGVNLTDEEYSKAREIAKNSGGYWSRFAGGFIFPSELAAKSFLNGGNAPSAESSQQGNNRLAYSSNTNNVNNSRIVPEDVDKEVSLQIENEFDSAIKNLNLTKDEKAELDKHISDYSNKSTIELEDIFYINNSRLGLRNEKKNNLSEMLWRRGSTVSPSAENVGGNLRDEKSGAESPTTANGEYSAVVSRRDGEAKGENTARGNEVQGQHNGPREIRNSGSDRLLLHEGRRIEEKVLSKTSGTKLSSNQRRLLAAQYAISRELVYRDIRLAALKQSLGLEEGKQTSLDEIAAVFEKTNTDKEVKTLFDKILAINKRLGTSVDIQASQEDGASGEAGTVRDVHYYLDGFTRTSAGKINIPVVIAHELLHQGTIGAINLVKKGKAEGILTKEQIDAVNTILDIYNKVKANPERLSESKRGLANPYEFAAQMVDPRQRRALSMSPLQRVIAAANELRAQGNPSLWQRIKNALKTLFGMSDLKKMDKAINTLLDTFSETVHDISMNDVDQSGWGYFIGEQGASNMDKAEEATTRLDNLNVARYFENQGKDPKTIKWATGWERGADGKWRYEIPDITIKPDNKVDNKKANTRVIGRGFSQPIAKLSDIVESKELFDAYPQLKDIDIVIYEPRDGSIAYYFPGLNTIALSSSKRILEDVYAPVENWDEINKYINEEQKLINALSEEEEDYYYDAKDYFGGLSEYELSKDKNWQKLKKDMPKVADLVILFNNRPEKIGGEVIGTRIKESEFVRGVLSHEIQHVIQSIENFAAGGSSDEYEDNEEYKSLLSQYLKLRNGERKAYDEWKKAQKEYNEALSEWLNLRTQPDWDFMNISDEEKELKKKIDKLNDKIEEASAKHDTEREKIKHIKKRLEDFEFRYYEYLGGEVESRNVQSRLNMTPEQRSRSLASETEDVAREDQIFIYDNFGKNKMVSKDLFDKYPTWLSGQTTGTGQHTTQITSTVNTYKKIGEWMKSQGMNGATVLDASSGLGKGTEALKEMGFNVEDVEPYPSETRTKPTYLKYEDIKGKYDVVISNAVLNVIPDDWRADVLKNMADKVKPGGKMIINVRDAKEMEKQKQKIELDSPSEILVTDKAGNIRAYQKGFTQKELADWIQSELGEGWTIETAKPSNSGISGRAVVVTRNTDTPLRYRKISDSTQKPKTSEEEKSRMRDAASSLAKSLNTPIKVISAEEAPEGAKNSKGYYDTRTGEVTIVLDNNASPFDVQRTVAHEVIGHKGLRGLLGTKNYYKIMNAVYDNLPQDEKDKINEAARRNGWQMYTAMDEYLAEQAENMVWDAKSASLWQNVKHYLAEAMRTLGFIVKPNLKDARYWLWLSKNQLKRGDVMSNIKRNALLAKLDKLGNPKLDELFKDNNDDTLSPQYLFRTLTDYDIEHKPIQESFKDYAISLKDFLKKISSGLGRNLLDNENAYLGENQMGSIAKGLTEEFINKQIKTLRNTIKGMSDVFGDNSLISKTLDYFFPQSLINRCEYYLYAKHGLERNRVLYVRDLNKKIRRIALATQVLKNADIDDIIDKFNNDFQAEKDWLSSELKIGNISYMQYLHGLDDFVKNYVFEHQNTNPQPFEIKAVAHINTWYKKNISDKYDPNEIDYSGLSAFEEYKENGQFKEDLAIDRVMAIEHSLGNDRVEKLWKAVQDVTQHAIDVEYKSGMISKATYDRCKTMFEWYIPLRGVSVDTMEDLYAYLGGKNDNGSAVETAKGRKTVANTPLATAYNMALRAINEGVRNQNNQRMYRAVNNWLRENPGKQAPATVVECWYELNNNGVFEMKTPDIVDGMTPEEITQKTREFIEDMKAKQRQGLAATKNIRPDYVKPFSNRSHANDHIVYVKINGVRKMIIFNGDPRPARVLRGEMNPGNTVVSNAIRKLSVLNTAWNPTFTLKNLRRDSQEASDNVLINEGRKYYKQFKKNQLRLMGDAFWVVGDIFRKNKSSYLAAFYKWRNGEEPTSYIEKMYFDFMKNGGATGFMEYNKLQDLQNKLYNDKSVASILKNPFATFGNLIAVMNELTENLNRFATYMTSIEMGRSVMTSVNNAKEITLNFNRRGAAEKTAKYGNTKKEAVFGWWSWWYKNTTMFFNPAVQSLYRNLSNMTRHPFKWAIFSAARFMGLSMCIPAINELLISMAGGDDDDKYSDLAPWVRRNNICLYNPFFKNWITLPISPNIAPLYGLGDIAYGYLFDSSLKTGYGLGSEIASQVAALLPFDYLGNSGSLKSPDEAVVETLAGDFAGPIVNIALNKNWLGNQIYKDTPFNKDDPEWQRCYSNTNKLFVWLSKSINSVDNDYEYIKGPLDNKFINPAIMQHLWESYSGGFGKEITNGISFAKDGDLNKLPVFRGFVRTPDNTNRYQRTRLKYNMYRDEADKLDGILKKLQRHGDLGDPLARAKYIGSEEKPNAALVRMMKFKQKEGEIKALSNRLKNETNETVKEAIELDINRIKKNLVDELDQIED